MKKNCSLLHNITKEATLITLRGKKIDKILLMHVV